MNRKKDKGRIEGAFVPMLVDTMGAPAWRAMSPYGRVLYVSLKARYSFKARNNGRLYLSTRQATKETGFNRKTVIRGFHEMQYYGFIVQTNPGCLGVNGKGKAPHWRLTELGYMLDPPTRDFMHWDGTVFHQQKSPEYYKRQERCIANVRQSHGANKKQNPGPRNGPPWTAQGSIPLDRAMDQLPDELDRARIHRADPARTAQGSISRLTTQGAQTSGGSGKLQWSTPVLEEVTDPAEIAAIRSACHG